MGDKHDMLLTAQTRKGKSVKNLMIAVVMMWIAVGTANAEDMDIERAKAEVEAAKRRLAEAEKKKQVVTVSKHRIDLVKSMVGEWQSAPIAENGFYKEDVTKFFFTFDFWIKRTILVMDATEIKIISPDVVALLDENSLLFYFRSEAQSCQAFTFEFSSDRNTLTVWKNKFKMVGVQKGDTMVQENRLSNERKEIVRKFVRLTDKMPQEIVEFISRATTQLKAVKETSN